jgi:hypothetical protein
MLKVQNKPKNGFQYTKIALEKSIQLGDLQKAFSTCLRP